jgi:hypothetical protein
LSLAASNLSFFKDNVKMKSFFRPIIENINRLQLDGLCINGRDLKFSFSTIVADNLAAHFLGGFQCNFSSGYFCRRCYVTHAEKMLPIDSIKIDTRTITHHDDLVRRINIDPSKSPLMGVTGSSPIISIIGFHPINSLPADIMHDFFEGVCPIVVLSLLKQASALRIMNYGE